MYFFFFILNLITQTALKVLVRVDCEIIIKLWLVSFIVFFSLFLYAKIVYETSTIIMAFIIELIGRFAHHYYQRFQQH